MVITAMVVDDDKDVLVVTKLMLERNGYKVHAFTDPTLALEHLETCKDCGVVLSDIKMPRMTGIELSMYVKKARPGINFILMSSMPIPRDEWRRVIPSIINIDEFIAKPFSIKELIGVIKKYGKEQAKQNDI